MSTDENTGFNLKIKKERKKQKKANNVAPHEMSRYEPSHLISTLFAQAERIKTCTEG